jgi:A/G-specific adenine glycosylase
MAPATDWFAERLLAWFDGHGRKDLPWQQDIDAYRVWISEIMLQQTQVATVIPYYQRFMTRFPTVRDLAAADLDDVLHHWTGLGYYARGRNLHKAARLIMAEHAGELPGSVETLETLPGIGRSTAGAIAAIAGGIRAPILDGNVKRVLARFHAVDGYPGESTVAKHLWALADEHTPSERVADYTQAIMDLGATICVRSRPDCRACPVADRCQALATEHTERYPGRKPKKEKPVRQARMFIAHDNAGACLLERRPPEGIWGSLWTPPERPFDTAVEDFLQEFGFPPLPPYRARTAPGFRHTFTHFHLDIEPVYVEVDGPPGAVRDTDDVRWYRSGSNDALGLSAPAVKLIASLSEFTLR